MQGSNLGHGSKPLNIEEFRGFAIAASVAPLIFVNTSEEVAQQRNQERKRTLPRDEVTKMWNGVQRNIGAFQRFFGNKNFIILDNNGANDDVLDMVFKRVRKLVTTPVKNYIAKQWIANELEKKRRR